MRFLLLTSHILVEFGAELIDAGCRRSRPAKNLDLVVSRQPLLPVEVLQFMCKRRQGAGTVWPKDPKGAASIGGEPCYPFGGRYKLDMVHTMRRLFADDKHNQPVFVGSGTLADGTRLPRRCDVVFRIRCRPRLGRRCCGRLAAKHKYARLL